MSNPVPEYLAKLHPHPRDEFITFDEGPHIYTVHGDSSFTSVTTWNHSHFEHFDSDAIIENILKNHENLPPKKISAVLHCENGNLVAIFFSC